MAASSRSCISLGVPLPLRDLGLKGERSMPASDDAADRTANRRRAYNVGLVVGGMRWAVTHACTQGDVMKTIGCAIVVMLSLAPSGAGSQGPPQPKPVGIFDGKTLNGWEGNLKMFRIQDGAIVGGSLNDKIVRNEFLCTTKSYSDFELRLKVKLLGGDGANAGIQFRTSRIPNHHEVSGYQADMGTGWWGALYDESRRNKVLLGPEQTKMKEVVKADDWNDYVIRAEGKRIQLSLNGVQTVDYTEEDPTVTASGVICVQIHSGPPSEAWYRDITIVDRARPSSAR
jgi:hypothetical protein